MTDLPNDLEQALAHNARVAGGSVLVEYGGLRLAVPKNEFDEALENMRKMPLKERRRIMASINQYLSRHFPQVKAGKASQGVAMKCAQEVTIWYANEVLEGRASTGVH